MVGLAVQGLDMGRWLMLFIFFIDLLIYVLFVLFGLGLVMKVWLMNRPDL